jgi:epoxyqueuosine reductase
VVRAAAAAMERAARSKQEVTTSSARRPEVIDSHHARAALVERIRAHAADLGFEATGIAPIHTSDHAAFYREWLARGRHGEMHYLARDDAVAARLDPASRWPHARSAIVVSLRYATPTDASSDVSDASRGIIARYARGRDYHKVLKKKLVHLLEWLEREVGYELPAARAYVDTGPVLERELARRADLGWYGRNTMLLHPRRGSYFFLGVLLTELDLPPDTPFEREHCGTCSACVDACPTGALLGRDENGAPVMDATRCISYLTIEHRGAIPVELRPLIGNRVFGCDICQEVCPWNAAAAPSPAGPSATAPLPAATAVARGASTATRSDVERRARFMLPVVPDLRARDAEAPRLVDLMRMSYDAWDVWSRGRAVRRAGYAGFRRNVAVAIGNWLASEDEPPEGAVAALRDALEDESDLVREHAAWALRQVDATASG